LTAIWNSSLSLDNIAEGNGKVWTKWPFLSAVSLKIKKHEKEKKRENKKKS